MSSNLKKMLKVASEKTRITPKLTGWLANHDEGVVLESETMAELLVGLLQPGGSRAYAFHPSQLYQCKRRQVFDYHDVPKLKQYRPQLQNIFNDGTWRHARWQVMLLNAGLLDRVEVKVELPQYRLNGSMDGINDKDGWMFELKGTSQFAKIRDKGVTPEHTKQVQAYLMAAELDTAVVIYEDKSTQDWKEFEVHQDDAVVKEITGILEVLNEAIDHDQLPEVLDACKASKGTAFNQCPYASVCLRATTAEDAKSAGIQD